MVMQMLPYLPVVQRKKGRSQVGLTVSPWHVVLLHGND